MMRAAIVAIGLILWALPPLAHADDFARCAEEGYLAHFDERLSPQMCEEITTADAYGRALNYLARLDAVKRVDVQKIEGTTVFFQLIAHGGLPALTQSISFGQVLSAVPEAPTRFRLFAP